MAPNGMHGKYAINWVEGFKTVQKLLFDTLAEGIYGSNHVRVMRVLRQKGFLEEKELTKFCLLPQRNLRAILSRLMSDGVIQTQDLPASVKGSGPLYGLHQINLLSMY